MSLPNTSGCPMTLATLAQQLELFHTEMMQKLNDLMYKEEVNQLWKMGMESTMHCVWDKVCAQRVSVSIGCQTDEQFEAQNVIWCESPNHLNVTGRSISGDQNCFDSNSEEDIESNNRDAPQQRCSNEPQYGSAGTANYPMSLRSYQKRTSSRTDCKDNLSQNDKSSTYHNMTSLNSSNGKSCFLFNDEEDQQSNSRYVPAEIVRILAGSCSTHENESTASVVPDTPQKEPSKRANTLRSEQMGSFSSTHCKPSQNGIPLLKCGNGPQSEKKKLYSCTRCGSKFTRKYNLLAHERKYGILCQKRARKLAFECVTCGKSFHTREQLRTHRRCHKEKKHLCPVCGRAFRSQAHVNRHMTTHTGEKPFQCVFCEKRFSRRDHFNYHIRTKHQQK